MFQIITDTCSDLPESYLKEHGLVSIPMCYEMGGKVYGESEVLPYPEFYARLRGGELPTTMAINPERTATVFRSFLTQGIDILYISFSSALSGTYSIAAMTARELQEEFPQSKIIVVDSLGAALGEGLLVHLALEQQKSGKTLEETAAWVEETRLHLCHQFTVDNLFHLFRGGRVSRSTAIIGTLAQIKPVMHVDNEGRLVPVGKVIGRKKSLNALVDRMAETIGSYEGKNKIFFIGHGDCLADAQYVADKVKERFGIPEVYIDYVSPTIGSHSGPGTVALFYLGDHR